jgi:hypothetical protein
VSRLRGVGLRDVAVTALGVLALAVVLTPWYALDDYTPNGWDATWWARIALVAALAAIVALRLGRAREAALLAALALACVAFRTIVVPDFGFGFDGLEVPVERRFGLWVALAAAGVATASAVRLVGGWRSASARPGGAGLAGEQ